MTRTLAPQPDPEHVDRLIEWYDAATPAETADGATWYATAYDHAAAIAAEYDLSPRGVAGAIAALSPLREWDRNLQDVRDVARAIATGGTVPVVHFAAHLERAIACLQGDDPLGVLGGPKVTAFYRAIMGDASAVTIDRWAILAATGKPAGKSTPTAKGYRDLQAEYAEAAARVDLEPRDFQAIVWTAIRTRAQDVPDL